MRRTVAPPSANVARTARPPVRGSGAVRRGRSATVVVPGPTATLRLTSAGRLRAAGVSRRTARHPGRHVTATRTPRRRTVARVIAAGTRAPRVAAATAAPGSGGGAGTTNGGGTRAPGAAAAAGAAAAGGGAGAGAGLVAPRATSASALSPSPGAPSFARPSNVALAPGVAE